MTAVPPVADLCDAHPGDVRVIDLPWQVAGGEPRFHGRAETLLADEDRSLIREVLSEDGTGRVLVISGTAAAQGPAMVGSGLMLLAARNGWAGLVVDGAVRGLRVLPDLPIGVRARRVSPRRGAGEWPGIRSARLTMNGTQVSPGEWIYADPDGVLVSSNPLH